MANRKNESGFSLMEIMVVMGVIAILTGIAVPAYYKYIEKGKTAEAMSDLKRIETAIIALGSDTGRWPGNQNIGVINSGGSNEIYDLSVGSAGLVATDGSFGANWNGPYIPVIPLDPWGHKYFMDTDYRINGVDNVVIGSYGTGAVCNNCYNDTDIRVVLPLK